MHNTYTVLVVEDEPSLRRLLEIALRQDGFTVLAAASGEEALVLYGQRSGEIGIVLMGVRMPGFDGVETLIQLRRINPAVRCFMSGESGPYGVDELRACRAAFVSKPFALPELAKLLRRLCAARPDSYHRHLRAV